MHTFSHPHHTHVEPHGFISDSKISWLRAAVLGANDGIVSVAAVVVGVAGATSDKSEIVTAGVAALFAGALSMAVGEYVSVSTQRDTEKALLKKERHELATEPERELEELVQIYEKKGLSHSTARLVAIELTTHDALKEHAVLELGIDPNNLTNPWSAALASCLAFLCGAIIPVITILIAPASYATIATFSSVIIALVITGALSANAGGAQKRVAILRVVTGGVLAMAVTYGIGLLFGVSGI